MTNLTWLLLLILAAFSSYLWGYGECLQTYYKRADSGKPFEANGKVYVMREIEGKDE